MVFVRISKGRLPLEQLTEFEWFLEDGEPFETISNPETPWTITP